MCLLVLAWRVHARYRLVVAANRDEFHARPAAPLAKWPPPAELLAGRDLRSQGTWLGIDQARRFGVVTNFRELQPPRTGAPSRGDLVPGFLAAHGEHPVGRAGDFLAALEPRAAAWSGFNLLLADADALWYASNRTTPFARELGPGVYGLANESLDTPWPKLQRVRSGFETWLWPPHEIALDTTAERTPISKMRNFAGTPTATPSALAVPSELTPLNKMRNFLGTPGHCAIDHRQVRAQVSSSLRAGAVAPRAPTHDHTRDDVDRKNG